MIMGVMWIHRASYLARNRADWMNLLQFQDRQPLITSGCFVLDNSCPKGVVMIIPFLIWSILIVVPTTLIAWWGVREDESDGRS